MGLGFIAAAPAVVAAVERGGTAAGQVWLATTHFRGTDAVAHLRVAPRGRDGTGKDVGETLRTVKAWLRRIEEAVLGHPAYARPVLEREVGEALARMERDIVDPEELRWSLRVEPEYFDQNLYERLVVLEALGLLRRLHADVEPWRQRVRRFDRAVRAADPKVKLDPRFHDSIWPGRM